ncbi:geranylgeranylglyceryl/heptaprenylglyceryl phosphate synthase [Candidatus Geothermarchaeota archaeon ex4572_27]|nr:MAG: geranylgeranylglyceryl/heptaprenylglyceryl phosphate synthase [Candidatus Geothermarchaeota archaeon ex4572_27]
MRVHSMILRKLRDEGAVHMSLLDPVSTGIDELPSVVSEIVEAGSDFIMVGGSTLVDQVHLSRFIARIKELCEVPVIIFPNNVSALSREADAIWFMSLLNSTNPYYIVQAQALAAPYIREHGIEPLPMAYLVVGEGRAAGFIGDAKPIPVDKPEIAAAYAMAAEMFGFRYVYLEAGSGARRPIPPDFIRVVKGSLRESKLIVGGGIRSGKAAYEAVRAGADIVVTGTVIEEGGSLRDIVDAVKRAGGERLGQGRPREG